MPILPLPQFEADLEEDRKLYESLKPPTSIVVRFGVLRMIGEFPYDGQAKPGCGSKLVVRTHRGTEIGEMLTSTCPNAGCSKSITRKEMLEYIENSGGKDYPFFNQGKVLRVATPEDLNEQARLDGMKKDMLNMARQIAGDLGLPMKIVEAEPILGRERVTFYFTSEERVDFRDLVSRLVGQLHTRIELRQIGARDEARITADYEKCGQHCCCKQFLKVLKPVSMKSAKVQKATLDPLKISGRCGRLMCCLRYEDQTYTELAKRLPRKKWRVETSEGTGVVIDGQILTQLVLVRLDHNGADIAVPVEELTVLGPPGPPGSQPPTQGQGGERPQREGRRGSEQGSERSGRDGGGRSQERRERPGSGGAPNRPDGSGGDRRDRERPRPAPPPTSRPPAAPVDDRADDGAPQRTDPSMSEPASGSSEGPGAAQPGSAGPEGRRRRRRRRRRRDGGPGGGAGGPPPPQGPPRA